VKEGKSTAQLPQWNQAAGTWLAELKLKRSGTEQKSKRRKPVQSARLNRFDASVLAHALALPRWRRVFVNFASAARRVLAGT
jgi:hypothetical protein